MKIVRLAWNIAIGCGVGLSCARSAHAAPPGNWSVAVERLFGLSRVSVETDTAAGSSSQEGTSISLFSAFLGNRGYSSPRLAIDYIASSGVSFGGAVAYETASSDDTDSDQSAWLVAPRLGYFARPNADFGVWLRAGLTHVSVASEGSDTLTATALTLEVPLVFLIGGPLGLTIMPHADIGIAGGTDTVDRTMTELGLQFGANAFF
jgi:hypothetical protein